MRTSRAQFGGFAALLALLVTIGCASLSVGSYVQRGIDLQRYHTFDWGPPDKVSTGDPRLDNNRFFDERVRMQIEKGLAQRGFEKTATSQPDLLVHYHANVTQEIEAGDLDRDSRYCDDEDCRPFVYDAGSLVVDIIERGTNRLVWRGWAEGSIEGVIDSQEFMEQRIDAAVRRILSRLPPL